MQTFQNTVTIARPVGEVFAFLADLRNIPRWNYPIARTVPTIIGSVAGSMPLISMNSRLASTLLDP